MAMAFKAPMMKLLSLIALIFTFSVFFSPSAFAQSDYVLPYPSYMPGNRMYKIHQIIEVLENYWYFGNFGKFDYNLTLSDKYLVEAKTLFDYKQYLLAYKALEKSNQYFLKTAPYLQKAKEDGKDISQKRVILRSAAEKHVEILQDLAKRVPDTLIWKPEKASSTTLDIKNLIQTSIRIRTSYL